MNGKKAKRLRRNARANRATLINKVTGERILVPVRAVYQNMKRNK